MQHTYFIFMSYLQLIPSSILVGLAIVIGITLLLRNYDKITHKCGKVLKLLFSIVLASTSAISWVLAFMCSSFGSISVDYALSAAYKAIEDLNAHILPNISSLLYDYQHRITEIILDIIEKQVKTKKEKVAVKEIKYTRLFEDVVVMFQMPNAVSLQ